MVATRTEKTTATKTEAIAPDHTIRSALGLLMRMRDDVLRGLLPMLAELSALDEGTLREPTLRRLALRMFCVQRYRQLRRAPEHRHDPDRVLAKLIGSEAVKIDPAWRCSLRSLQVWIKAWNAVGDGGVAAGWRGLIRPSWGDPPSRSGSGGSNPGRRSPEAIAYFNRHYLGGRGKSIATCHRMTLNTARRRGWNWPETCGATRSWASGGLRGKRSRARRDSTRVRTVVECESAKLN